MRTRTFGIFPIPRRAEAFQYCHFLQIACRFAKVSSSVILKSALAISHIGDFLISITFFIRLNKRLFEANWRYLAQIEGNCVLMGILGKRLFIHYIFFTHPPLFASNRGWYSCKGWLIFNSLNFVL